MSFLPSFSRPPIGLDIGTRLIKAVQVGNKRGRAVVTASASIGRSASGETLDHDEVKRHRG